MAKILKEDNQEIYGGNPVVYADALENMKNTRKLLKDRLKPVEKATDELAKDTATEKIRLQGTKEPSIPKLKPYTEAVDVKDRAELSKLIEQAKVENKLFRVGRSLKEGFRYTFMSECKELKEEEVLPVDLETGEPVTDELPPEMTEIGPEDGLEASEAPVDNVIEPEAEEVPEMTALDVILSQLKFEADKDNNIIVSLIDADEDDKVEIKLPKLSDEQLAAMHGILASEGPEPEESEEDEEPKADESEKEFPNEDEVIEVDEELEEDLVEPNAGESEQDYVSRFMGTELAKKEFPDEKQRLAVAYSKFRDKDECLKEDDELESCSIVKPDEEIEEDLKVTSDLDDYEPWAGAVNTWERIVEADKVEELDFLLEDMYPDGINKTALNDILWFEADWVFDQLGLTKEKIEPEDDEESKEDLEDIQEDEFEEPFIEPEKELPAVDLEDGEPLPLDKWDEEE